MTSHPRRHSSHRRAVPVVILQKLRSSASVVGRAIVLTPGTTMSLTLPAARDAFIAGMKRDTKGTELARLVGVLDAPIKWSVARPQMLAFRHDTAAGVFAFECVPSKAVCWSARITRDDAPSLELY